MQSRHVRRGFTHKNRRRERAKWPTLRTYLHIFTFENNNAFFFNVIAAYRKDLKSAFAKRSGVSSPAPGTKTSVRG
jgi:hypothetical protein